MPDRAVIEVSGNVLKNVKSVSVPNTDGMKSVDSACVIGIVGGDAELKLEVLQPVDREHVLFARQLLENDSARSKGSLLTSLCI